MHAQWTPRHRVLPPGRPLTLCVKWPQTRHMTLESDIVDYSQRFYQVKSSQVAFNIWKWQAHNLQTPHFPRPWQTLPLMLQVVWQSVASCVAGAAWLPSVQSKYVTPIKSHRNLKQYYPHGQQSLPMDFRALYNMNTNTPSPSYKAYNKFLNPLPSLSALYVQQSPASCVAAAAWLPSVQSKYVTPIKSHMNLKQYYPHGQQSLGVVHILNE